MQIGKLIEDDVIISDVTRRDGTMRKSGVKTRDIRFFSEKNDTMLCVRYFIERDYA